MSSTTVKNTVAYLDSDYVVINRPLQHHKLGLMYTANGYGSKLPTRYMLSIDGGRYRRVYATCFSNVASYWVVVSGKKLYLRDSDFGSRAANSVLA